MQTTQLKQLLSELANRPAHELHDGMTLRDLIVDSFDMIEMVVELQEETGIRLTQDDLRELDTVGDVLRFFSKPREELGT